MIGEKIKQLRIESGFTQKDLADKLFVTAQAVSRWEKNEVEPSLETLTKIAKIFNVTVANLLGEESETVVVEKEVVKEVYKPQKPVLAVCEECNKPVYEATDVVRVQMHNGSHVFCRSCYAKKKQKEKNAKIFYGKEQRRKSFVWGGIFSGIIAITLLIIGIATQLSNGETIGLTIAGVLFFPFLSCLYLKNNFVGDMVVDVASWGFVRFPGLIFSLDLDGIIWFITVKLLFAILGFILAFACVVLAIALGYVISIFVYPFALIKSIKRPDLSERI